MRITRQFFLLDHKELHKHLTFKPLPSFWIFPFVLQRTITWMWFSKWNTSHCFRVTSHCFSWIFEANHSHKTYNFHQTHFLKKLRNYGWSSFVCQPRNKRKDSQYFKLLLFKIKLNFSTSNYITTFRKLMNTEIAYQYLVLKKN